MLDDLKGSYQKFLDSDFEAKGYLCSVFSMTTPKDLENASWQFDFYDKESDRINSFQVVEDEVKEINVDSEVFKEEHQVLGELDIDAVKVSFEDAYKKAEERLKEKNEYANKIIIVLQKGEVNPFWNLSFVTDTFNVFNIKIDADSADILDEKIVSLLSFKAN